MTTKIPNYAASSSDSVAAVSTTTLPTPICSIGFVRRVGAVLQQS